MNKSLDCSDEAFRQVLFAMCKQVDSPHALAVWLCYKYDHEALVDLLFDPKHYGDAILDSFCRRGSGPMYFAQDLAVSEFYSKYKGLQLNRDTKELAIQSFKASEQRMSQVNDTLKKVLRNPAEPRFEAIISIARRKISEVLGCLSDSEVDGGWGPGATFTVKHDVAWDKKILEKRISVTASCRRWAAMLIGRDLHWCQARGIPAEGPCCLMDSEFKVVPGNRITTVPKNAKTDRTIAIEPTANIYLQKTVGNWIRRRLRKVARIDLDDQSVNQNAAGTLKNATIDLKAASDSVSISVVRLLLPDEWIDWLDELRSPSYKLGNIWARYEKWSSMGNGYTFELETLVFWAIASAVQIHDSSRSFVRVYGDDIIVPVGHAETTIEALNYFGFETNLKKTHFESLYRESCGSHYFDNWLITPAYQKEIPNHVEELYNMANRIRHLASRLGGYYYSCKTFLNAWSCAVRLARSRVRRLHYVPYLRTGDGLSGALQLSIEDCESLDLQVYSWGTSVKHYRFITRKRPYDQAAGLSLVLKQRYGRQDRGLDYAHIDDDTLSGEEVAMRGQGEVRLRNIVSYRSFSSNFGCS